MLPGSEARSNPKDSLLPLPFRIDELLDVNVYSQLLSQSIVVLAARAGTLFEHDDGTDIAPVIDFVPLAVVDLIDPQYLNQRLPVVSAGKDLHVRAAQSFVSAKGTAAEVFDDRDQLPVFGKHRQRILGNLRDRGNAEFSLQCLGQPHDLTSNQLVAESGLTLGIRCRLRRFRGLKCRCLRMSKPSNLNGSDQTDRDADANGDRSGHVTFVEGTAFD